MFKVFYDPVSDRLLSIPTTFQTAAITSTGQAVVIGDGTNTLTYTAYSGARGMVGYTGGDSFLQSTTGKGVGLVPNSPTFGTASGGYLYVTTSLVSLNSTQPLGWGASIGVVDTGVSRTAAGIIAVGNGTAADASGRLIAATLKVLAVTVAALPAATGALEGLHAGVTDALAPTFMATVVGGGAVHCPVYCNGTNWIVG